MTRESVAQAFYISPNYLSHLFQKTGAIGFNEYLNHTRLEHAKTLLKGYDLKVKEVAHRCGFVDSNYFCRLFRKNTERSPSEYRRQYHSQLTEKNPHHNKENAVDKTRICWIIVILMQKFTLPHMAYSSTLYVNHHQLVKRITLY